MAMAAAVDCSWQWFSCLSMYRVIIRRQRHCFCVTALVMSELDNLGVDCLLCDDAINHMGGVTVGRDLKSKYSVTWEKISLAGCCDLLR